MKHEETHFIEGRAGRLEAKVMRSGEDARAFGIICHPHPLYGGTMNNKVVTTLVRTFHDKGANTIRFNFRGVGASVGQFDHGKGEVEDLYSILSWVKQEAPQARLWLAGFSFGAYIAAKVANAIEVERLIVVAPPVRNFLMTDLKPLARSWCVVQGGQDEVVSAQAVLDWANSFMPLPEIIYLPEASHFFHGRLGELRARVEEYLI